MNAAKKKKCHALASCTNTQVSQNSSCNPNYVGDDFNCEGVSDIFHDSQFVKQVLG